MQIAAIDHVVLTVRDLERSRAFYEGVLGMRVVEPARGPIALHFGSQKLHLHVAGHEFDPKATLPTPGSGDLCFITTTPLDVVIAELEQAGAEIIVGPVPRTGATGPIRSVYVRDPDGNLIELANQLEA